MKQARSLAVPVTIPLRRGATLVLLVVLLALLGVLAYQGWRVYARAQAFSVTVHKLQVLLSTPQRVESLATVGPLLARARADAQALHDDAAPFVPVAEQFGWVPHYGPELAASGALLDIAVDLTTAADEAFTAFAPLLQRPLPAASPGAALAQELPAARPHILAAQQALLRVQATWPRLQLETLDPPIQAPLAQVEALMPAALDGLEMALALPELLGVDGARTYLVLAQNQDELRATGGLITAVGVLALEDGRVVDLAVADSSTVDRLDLPQPDAPEPLQRYMNIQLWLLRDSNWSPDFPTAARTALDMYEYAQGIRPDGVIAFDQTALPLILAATGPLLVEGSSEPISAVNVIDYMRNASFYTTRAAAATPWSHTRKDFLQPLAQALVAQLESLPPDRGPALAQALLQVLDERRLQVYVEQPQAAALLARRNWDGAVRPGNHDFLLVVDSNVGYNKATTTVHQHMRYEVDLRDPAAPVATLVVTHQNQQTGTMPCDQRLGFATIHQITGYEQTMLGCYWDYLRVLIPDGSALIAAAAQPVPPEWLLTGDPHGGTVTFTKAAGGANQLAVLVVIPPGEQRRTVFRYRLPQSVLARDGRTTTYELLLRKQAGADRPVTVAVRLPPEARLVDVSGAPAHHDGHELSFSLMLTRDQLLAITFREP